MRRKILHIMCILLALISICIIKPNKVEADSYKISDMNIEAIINEDGSVSIVQDITYDFNGSYNGIYLNIPIKTTYLEQKVISDSKINNSLYEGDSVTVNEIKVKNSSNNNEVIFQEVQRARNGDRKVYTTYTSGDEEQIKIYYPVSNKKETFQISYKINNLCVNHEDIGELYYNFIGGEWECLIENLNIDIYLPNNENEILIWGHGPLNGESKILSNKHASFKVTNVNPGEYVAARIVFDKNNIAESKKYSGITAKEIILNEEKEIAGDKNHKKNLTLIAFLLSIVLIIYWIVLLLIYERDKRYVVSNINEEELFKKYNPLLAGCIEETRDILSRDIIAVILNLINKGNIKLEIRSKSEKTGFYRYIIKRVPEKENEMDKIEKFIYNWVLNSDEVVLENRLKAIPKDKNANHMFKMLNNLTKTELKKIGANSIAVPPIIRALNVIILIGMIIFVIYHVTTLDFKQTLSLITILSPYLIIICPTVITLLLNVIIKIRHLVSKNVQKITGQKVVSTTITMIILTAIVMIITAFIIKEHSILWDELLISIAVLIVLTDNLMMKNSPRIAEDYSRLKGLKEKLENTLLGERDIEYIYLWNQYLAYAVSFGIGEKIIKKMSGIYLDDDLLNLVKQGDMLEYITTNYYAFYMYASLDRIFLRNYNKVVGTVLSSASSGRGGGFSGGGGFHGGGGRGGGGGAF